MKKEYKLNYAQLAQRAKDFEENKFVGQLAERTIVAFLKHRGSKVDWMNEDKENYLDYDIIADDNAYIDVKYCNSMRYGVIRIQILDETHKNPGWALRGGNCNWFCFTDCGRAVFISKADLIFVYNNMKGFWKSNWEVRENCQICYDIPVKALQYYIPKDRLLVENIDRKALGLEF